MRQRASGILFLLVTLGAATYVGFTSESLPQVLASHFDGSGAANGYMPRTAYRVVMVVLCVVVPLLIGWLPMVAAGPEGRNIKIPNRDYWLAPHRRDDTLAFLRAHGQWFAMAVVVFLAYVHGLVVQANALQPPRLATLRIQAGLLVLSVFLVVWLWALFARFRRMD